MKLEELLDNVETTKGYDIMEMLIEKLEIVLNNEEIIKIKMLKGEELTEYLKNNYEDYKRTCYLYDTIEKLKDYLINFDYLMELDV